MQTTEVSRRRHLLHEVVRFLTVGGAATLVSLLLFNLLLHGIVMHPLLDGQPTLAYVLANSVGMYVSYTGSRHFAFPDRPTTHRDGGRTAYVVINVVTMSIPVACLALSRHVLGLSDPVSDNLAANVIGLGLAWWARWHLFRTFVFHRPISLVEMYDEPDLSPAGPPTAPATGGPVVPPALGAAAG